VTPSRQATPERTLREAPAGPPPGRRTRRRALLVLCLAAAGLLGALAAGHDVHERLTPGGTTAIGAESGQADELLRAGFRAGDPDLVLVARAGGPVDGARADEAGSRLASRLAAAPGVAHVTSYWEARDPSLRSRDGRAALVVARLEGDDLRRIETARRLVPGLTGRHGPLEVGATGKAQVRAEIQDRSERDLRWAELIAAPLTLVVLLLVFGGVLPAALPVLVGALAVTGTMAVLRLLTLVTDVSVFAMSVASALGFALAVDFSLFVVTRFREELAAGRDPAGAIGVTLRTTGRAVGFSAAAVSLSLAALLIFPFTILRSIAYGGIAVTVLAALGGLVVLPAVLVLLGDRINGTRVPGRHRGRPPGYAWHRLAMAVMRRPLRVAVPTALLLAALGLPFLGVRFGMFDDRLLPPDAPAAQASHQVRSDFDLAAISRTSVVLPELRVTASDHGWSAARLDAYARRLSSLDGVTRVDTATGSYTHGAAARAANVDARFTGPAGTWLAISTAHEPASVENSELAERIRLVPAPGKAKAGGPGAELADIREGVGTRLPVALGLVVMVTFALITALTGSVVLGAKALVMNALSLGATFGVLVHIFQDGNLRGLVGDFAVTGFVDALAPALLFCVAFGLSMDYEIFLLARITEEYRRGGDTVTAVATGLQRTGRLFTSAALVFAVVMAALATSGLALLKMIGVGLALAVLLDATLVRALLVPAVMRLAGRANWWTPLSGNGGRLFCRGIVSARR